MGDKDTPQERQENEMEALKAIFAREMRDVRNDQAWGLWSPLDLIITVTPQQGSSGPQEAHVTIDLHIICSSKYPDELPSTSCAPVTSRALDVLRSCNLSYPQRPALL
uniref:RWD domain-containing protein n=1 Tax=Timema cristinae TaxID=61476 RepID=A0A7R9CKI1_TIMCR|nr:unnamed protein product [Timema cristinae]